VRYLLDTCLLSELRKPTPDPGVAQWVENTEEDRLFISVLSLGEIQKGIAKLQDGRRKSALQHWLEHDLSMRFQGRILPIDTEAALEWGLLCAASERRGLPMPVIDGLLSVTAITRNLTVITRNDKDFSAYPVKTINPWSTEI